jgi:predicted ATPase
MADLERFRAKVKEYRLLVNRNQGDLASYLNLDYTELSNRLNASKKAYLTHENTRAIVRALADWGAIATRAQATELLDLLACPYFDEVDWQARPLSKLSNPPGLNLTRAEMPSNHLQNTGPNLKGLTQSQDNSSGAHTQHSDDLINKAKQKHNLPNQMNTFVGRQDEIGEITTLLTPDRASAKTGKRLLTLTGVGGTGKTRLALQVAASLLNSFGDGVWVVELASLSNPEHIPQIIAEIFGLPEQPGEPILPALIESLCGKELLLVLDNCEHLIEGVCQLVARILGACPNLQILATSREALDITAETIFTVPPLSMPSHDDQLLPIETLTAYDAVRLFIDRAQSANPKFKLTNEVSAALVQVLHHLDGIPLAIELAAARTKILNLDQINSRLTDRFHLLTKGNRSAIPRQQTLKALIDWSYDLLTEPEQILLRRLCVFAGSWPLEAAELIGTGPGIETGEVLDLLSQLVNKSLVVVDEQEQGGKVLYHLLETIRQYGQEKLLADGEELPWEKAIIYLDKAGDRARSSNAFGEARIFYAGVLEALTHLPPNSQNTSRRIQTLLKQAAVYLTNTTKPQQMLEQLAQASKQVEVLLESDNTESYRLQLAWLHFWLSRYYYLAFNYPLSLQYSQQLLGWSQQTGNPELEGLAAWMKGRVLTVKGEYARAKVTLNQAVALLQKAGQQSDWLQCMMWYGWALAANGYYAEGLAELEQARTYCLETDNQIYLSLYYLELTLIHQASGNLAEGLKTSQLAVEAATRNGENGNLITALYLRSLFESCLGQHKKAGESLARAQQLLQIFGGQIPAFDAHIAEEALIMLQAGRLEQAIEKARQALALGREVGSLYTKGIAERVWGEALSASGPGNYQEAETHLAASVTAFERGGAILYLAQSCIAWGDLYVKQDKFESALEKYHKAKSLLQGANLIAVSELINRRITDLEIKR